MKKIKRWFNTYFKLSYKKKIKLHQTVTMVINYVWASVKILFGIVMGSYFICVSGIYSIGIGFAKNRCITGINLADNVFEKEKKYYFQATLILLVTALIYIIYMIRLFYFPSTMQFGMIPGIGLATIAFCELGVAIYGIVKTNQKKDVLLHAMKCISLSSALTAIVMAQIALMSFSMADQDPSSYNAIGGIVFGVLCIFICLYMVIYYRIIKNQKVNQND